MSFGRAASGREGSKGGTGVAAPTSKWKPTVSKYGNKRPMPGAKQSTASTWDALVTAPEDLPALFTPAKVHEDAPQQSAQQVPPSSTHGVLDSVSKAAASTAPRRLGIKGPPRRIQAKTGLRGKENGSAGMAGAGAGVGGSAAAAVPPTAQRSKFMMMKSKYKTSNEGKPRTSGGSMGNFGSAAAAAAAPVTAAAAAAAAEVYTPKAAMPIFSASMWTDGATFSPGPQTPMALNPSDDSLPPTPATAIKVLASKGPPPVPGAASHRMAMLNMPIIQAPAPSAPAPAPAPTPVAASNVIDQSVIDALEAEVEAEAAAAEVRKERRRAAFNKKIKKRASICILSSPKKADAASSRVQSLMSRFEKKHVNRSSLNNVESPGKLHGSATKSHQQKPQQPARRAPVSKVVVPAAIYAMSPDAIAQRSSSPNAPAAAAAVVANDTTTTATAKPSNNAAAAAAAEKIAEEARAFYKSIAAEAKAKARVNVPAQSQALAAFRSSTGSDRPPSSATTVAAVAVSAPTATTTSTTTAVVAAAAAAAAATTTAAEPLTKSAAALLFSSFKPKTKELEQRVISQGLSGSKSYLSPHITAKDATARSSISSEFWTPESTPASTPQSILDSPVVPPVVAAAAVAAAAAPAPAPAQPLTDKAALLLTQGLFSSPLAPKAKTAPQPPASAFSAAMALGITTAVPTRTLAPAPSFAAPGPMATNSFSTPNPADARMNSKKKMKYANTPIDRNVLKKGYDDDNDDDDEDDDDDYGVVDDVSGYNAASLQAPNPALQMPNRARLMAASATPESDAGSPFMMRGRDSLSSATPDLPPVRGFLGLAGFLDSPADSSHASSPDPILNESDHIGAVDDSIMSTGTPRAHAAETPIDMLGTDAHADEQSLSAMKAELDRMNQEADEEKEEELELQKEMEMLKLEEEKEAIEAELMQASIDKMNAELAELDELAAESPAPSPSPSPDFGADIDEMTLRLSPLMAMAAASPAMVDSPAGMAGSPAMVNSPVAYSDAEVDEIEDDAAAIDDMLDQISMLDMADESSATPTPTKAVADAGSCADDSFIAVGCEGNGANDVGDDSNHAAAAIDTSVVELASQLDTLTTNESDAEVEEIATSSLDAPHSNSTYDAGDGDGGSAAIAAHDEGDASVSTVQPGTPKISLEDEVDMLLATPSKVEPASVTEDDSNVVDPAEDVEVEVEVEVTGDDEADASAGAGADASAGVDSAVRDRDSVQGDALDEANMLLARPAVPAVSRIVVSVEDDRGEAEDTHYNIDRLLDSQKDRKGIKWLVKWDGFPEAEATWQPESQLQNDLAPQIWDELLREYDASKMQTAVPVALKPVVMAPSPVKVKTPAPAPEPKPASAKKKALYCDVCEQKFKTKPGLGRHMSSKKHAKVVAAKETEAAAAKEEETSPSVKEQKVDARVVSKTETASSNSGCEEQQQEEKAAASEIIINETFCTVCDQELRNERGVKRHLGTKKHARALLRHEEILAEQEMLDFQEAEEKAAAEAQKAGTKSSGSSGGEAVGTLVETDGSDSATAKTTIEMSALDVLLDTCGQTSVLGWKDALGPKASVEIAKVGEGTFAEVFCGEYNGRMTAFKIMPFDGSMKVNDEIQKTSKELVPEVVASVELSALAKSSGDFVAHNFIHLESVTITSGAYPPVLMEEWNAWDQEHTSENETPAIFGEGQLFIVFAFANGGQDLEAFEFDNMEQAKSMLKQICVSLAVSEKVIAFEHRDLHWGNILLRKTKKPTLEYCLGGKKMVVDTHGVHSSIIDFTLSRLERNGEPFFFDLETDECYFEGEGDMQFDCYRSMRKAVKKDWSRHFPRTNLYWIQYLIDKVLNEKCYADGDSDKIDAELVEFYKRVLRYRSMKGLLKDKFFGFE